MCRALALVTLLFAACASVRHSNNYYVKVGTYWQPQQAGMVADDIAVRGYDVFIEESFDTLRSARPMAIIVSAERGRTYPTTSVYIVQIGPYHDPVEADRARDDMRASGFRAYVVHH